MGNGLLLLAGYTARAQAYAQALAKAGVVPESVVMFGDPKRDVARPEAARPAEYFEDVFLPDLEERLTDTFDQHDWQITTASVETVNDPAIAEILNRLNPTLVIYAGYGGQLVKPEILDLGFPILHCHPGWLPEYRGSTTVYFSLLEERACAVSALVLDSGIDTGPVILKRRYPAPEGMDVDYLYDNAIRADAMISVVNALLSEGTLPHADEQPAEGWTYYVIHPLLKHLALLSLQPDGRENVSQN